MQLAEGRVDMVLVADHARDQGAFPDKVRDKAVGGPMIEVVRGVPLHDVALIHHRNPVGKYEGLVLVVGHQDGRRIFGAQDLAYLARQFAAHIQIHAGETARRAAGALGRGARARARAMRCCCPPESSCGKDSP